MNKLPTNCKQITDTYFQLLNAKLPNFLESYYLYGSISLGAFTHNLSDIDFIAVLYKKLTDTELSTLKELHKELQKQFPKTNLDGFYVLKEDFENLKNEDTCPVFREGKFQGYTSFNHHSIDAFQLKKYGITLLGPDVDTLNYSTDWDILLDDMMDNLNSYWLNWKNKCEKFPSLLFLGLFVSENIIEWGVLGVSRLYYTFHEKDTISKLGAGEYALNKVPKRWHKILQESLRVRKGNTKSLYTSKIERRNDVLQYMNFIIQESNRLFPKYKKL